MRWRFVDRIDAFEPWRSIAGRKAASFEETCLCERFDRAGILPETIVVESCVELIRWLVAGSSGFAQTSAVGEVEHFSFPGEARMGEVLSIAAEVVARDGSTLKAACRVSCKGRPVAEGALSMNLMPMAEGFDRAMVEGTWRELYGKA